MHKPGGSTRLSATLITGTKVIALLQVVTGFFLQVPVVKKLNYYFIITRWVFILNSVLLIQYLASLLANTDCTRGIHYTVSSNICNAVKYSIFSGDNKK